MATPNLMAITSVVPALLYSNQLASGDNTLYTVPASTAVKLTRLTLCNISGSPVVVSVSVVPSGGSLDGTHKIAANYSLATTDTVTVEEVEGVLLPEGAYVSVNAATATAVDAMLNGLVMS